MATRRLMPRKRPDKRKSKQVTYNRPYWFDRARSLCELQGWPGPAAGDGRGLIGRHDAAIAKPVGKLDARELVLLFGQRTDPHFLVPIALELVDDELLGCLVTLDEAFWTSHPYLRGELVRVARAAVDRGVDDGLGRLLAVFLAR